MDNVKWLLGINLKDLNMLQMGLRAVIIYLCALITVRIGDKRFIGKTTAFDFIFGIFIGSLLSRAINGNAPLLPTIFTALVLVAMHWLFSVLAFKFKLFGSLIKGDRRILIRDGKINWKEMKSAHLTEDDLKLELRYETGKTKIEEIKTAYFERNGRISFIQYPNEKIFSVKAEEGIQNIHINLK